jgi:predicted DsbA family dithiol-disulfide isomerase
MPMPLRIDFVSDVMCPWCIIGLKSLEAALANTTNLVTPDLHFQPFELNPDMPPEGENTAQHIARKYGADPARAAASRSALKDAASAHNFEINSGPDSRIWNSFDCHRLLHWAGLVSPSHQRALKLALFEAHFTHGEPINDPQTLINAAKTAKLDPEAATEVLTQNRYAEEVRTAQAGWRAADINAVPAIIFNRQYLVVGGQPPEAFQQIIEKIAAKAA